ncbi:MAG: dihydrodipicolinate synthase family protein [Casimicrobiaceae bacterium]
MPRRIQNVVVPLLTPLDADEHIDMASLRRMVDFLIAGNVDAIFVLGSIGEGPALRPAERRKLALETVRAVAGRCAVIAGAIEPSTARIIDEIDNLSGVGLDGFVATTPFYYSGYSDADLVAHFRAIAARAPAPLIAYNIPQNTKIALRSAVVRALAGIPNIAGLKDSSGDWTEFQATLLDRSRPRDFVVLQGMQQLSAVSMLAGADGLVPGMANVHPALLVDLCTAARAGRIADAMHHQATLDRLLAVRGRATQHANKLMASRRGLMQDHVTHPLPRMTDAEASAFLEAAAAVAPLPSVTA